MEHLDLEQAILVHWMEMAGLHSNIDHEEEEEEIFANLEEERLFERNFAAVVRNSFDELVAQDRTPTTINQSEFAEFQRATEEWVHSLQRHRNERLVTEAVTQRNSSNEPPRSSDNNIGSQLSGESQCNIRERHRNERLVTEEVTQRNSSNQPSTSSDNNIGFQLNEEETPRRLRKQNSQTFKYPEAPKSHKVLRCSGCKGLTNEDPVSKLLTQKNSSSESPIASANNTACQLSDKSRSVISQGGEETPKSLRKPTLPAKRIKLSETPNASKAVRHDVCKDEKNVRKLRKMGDTNEISIGFEKSLVVRLIRIDENIFSKGGQNTAENLRKQKSPVGTFKVPSRTRRGSVYTDQDDRPVLRKLRTKENSNESSIGLEKFPRNRTDRSLWKAGHKVTSTPIIEKKTTRTLMNTNADIEKWPLSRWNKTEIIHHTKDHESSLGFRTLQTTCRRLYSPSTFLTSIFNASEYEAKGIRILFKH